MMSGKTTALLLSISLAIILACGMLPGAANETIEETAAESQLPDISGNYTVSGTNADDSTYTGEASIFKEGNEYTINWVIAGENMSGRGTFDGQTYHVKWEASWGTGEAIYSLTSDGSLEGTWTTEGGSGQGTEQLKPK